MGDSSPNGRAEGEGDQPELDNGQRAYETLGRYLTDDGWHPQALPEVHGYRMYYHGANGELRCFAAIRVEHEQLLCYAYATVRVPEEARPAAAEFLTRANYGMRIGNFELNYNDGEVRYKSSIDFEGQELTPTLIRNAIYPAVRVMDEYLPGLLKVAFGSKGPAEAIREIEG